MPSTVMAFVEDLLFLTRIRETGKQVGVAVVTGDSRSSAAAIAEVNPQAIFLDLNARALSALDWIRLLKTDPSTRMIRIVAFVSHVQKDLIAAARAAGCDVVLARSAFIQQLPDLLRNH